MSVRRKPGDIVIKKQNGGFLKVRLRIQIESDPEYAEYESCALCDDPECKEWANTNILDGAGGCCYHVSECEMEDDMRVKNE